jgi:hypothetical protein
MRFVSDTVEYSIRFFRSFSADKSIDLILSPRGNVTRARADNCCKMNETDAFLISYGIENEVRDRERETIYD